jgi:membrane-bound lytic murein transglycosylase D
MMAKDVSTPVAPRPVTAPAAQETAAPASTTAAAAPAPSTEALTASAVTPAAAPVTQTPVREMSAAEVAAAAEAKIFGETPKAVPAQSTPVEKPINIADEKAVEEQKPEEPQDEFSKLKARLDKVVYAPSRPSPAPAATLATANTSAPVTEKPVPNAAGTTYHIVKAGETAFGISKHYGITMQQLMDLNKLTFGSGIKVGQKLRVK